MLGLGLVRVAADWSAQMSWRKLLLNLAWVGKGKWAQEPPICEEFVEIVIFRQFAALYGRYDTLIQMILSL